MCRSALRLVVIPLVLLGALSPVCSARQERVQSGDRSGGQQVFLQGLEAVALGGIAYMGYQKYQPCTELMDDMVSMGVQGACAAKDSLKECAVQSYLFAQKWIEYGMEGTHSARSKALIIGISAAYLLRRMHS